MTPEYLRQTGAAVYGPEWQRALARGLGPLHPEGARDAIDDSLVRKWARGARPIPSWVAAALLTIIDQAASDYSDRADDLRRIAAGLRSRLSTDG
jgi:hypothetical protein